jgi:hypothetical protein
MEQREDYADYDPPSRRAPVIMGVGVIAAALVLCCLAGIGLLALLWLFADSV